MSVAECQGDSLTLYVPKIVCSGRDHARGIELQCLLFSTCSKEFSLNQVSGGVLKTSDKHVSQELLCVESSGGVADSQREQGFKIGFAGRLC